jgi:transcriptional regulator with XRE-family HTH domain
MIFQPELDTEGWELRLGVDIRSVRRRHRLTQQELATRANVSLSAVKGIEKGAGSSLTTLVRIARALDRTEWLRSFAPVEPSVTPLAQLKERQRETREAQKRVRHSKTEQRPS